MSEKLSEYLYRLHHDKRMVIDDRVLYLFDTVNNLYYKKVLHPAHIDEDGATYEFLEDDEPFHAYDKLNVVRAWTVTNAVNCMMGLEALTGNYCESEVD